MDEDTKPQEVSIQNMNLEDINDSEKNDTTHLVKEGAIDEDHTR